MTERTRVLIVDDSAVMRELLVKILSADPELEVVGTARDGTGGLLAVERLQPDVITLDVEMPGISGLEVLTRLRGKNVKVVVVASSHDSSCDLTVQALTLGAFDFVAKPVGMKALATLGPELIGKLKAAAFAQRRFSRARTAPTAPARTPTSVPAAGLSRAASSARAGDGGRSLSPIAAAAGGGGRQLIAIGASTGGPEALAEVIQALPANSPPVLIVQHMPEAFTAKFAQRLNGRSAITVEEATDGARVRPGLVLLAPGSRRHMVLVRSGHELVVRLIDSAPIMHHRPSVDVLFNSCADVLGRRAVGALLTGMGTDGARGLLAMRRAGAITIAQDEASSVVYGMPMEAASIGAAMHVLSLSDIGPSLVRLVQGGGIAKVA